MNNYIDISKLGVEAKDAAKKLRTLPTSDKNKLLIEIYHELISEKNHILEANFKDLDRAKALGTKDALLERLELNEIKFQSMVDGLKQVVDLKDPVGESDGSWINEDGLEISSKRVPIGVIGIIYESRPNVTVDAASLCLKTGNAVILKGGSDAIETNMAIMKAIKKALNKCNLPEGCVQLIESTDRALVKDLLEATEYVDCIIPRGGAGLIQFVVHNSKVPVIETGAGNCHIFVDATYDIDNALDIIENAKVQRPGACNAVETLLVHEQIAPLLIPKLVKRLSESNVYMALCDKAMTFIDSPSVFVSSATDMDWETEYLDFKLAIKIVPTVQDAVDHIDLYSTGHSESILTESYDNAQFFLAAVDSSTVYVNASTRFTDGNVFGFGAEIGISTQKLHARGPMGLKALTSNKYTVLGSGQFRK